MVIHNNCRTEGSGCINLLSQVDFTTQTNVMQFIWQQGNILEKRANAWFSFPSISALVIQQLTHPHPNNHVLPLLRVFLLLEGGQHAIILPAEYKPVLSHDWWEVVSLVWQVRHFKDVKILPYWLQQQNIKFILFQSKHKVDFLYLLQVTASLAYYHSIPSEQLLCCQYIFDIF